MDGVDTIAKGGGKISTPSRLMETNVTPGEKSSKGAAVSERKWDPVLILAEEVIVKKSNCQGE